MRASCYQCPVAGGWPDHYIRGSDRKSSPRRARWLARCELTGQADWEPHPHGDRRHGLRPSTSDRDQLTRLLALVPPARRWAVEHRHAPLLCALGMLDAPDVGYANAARRRFATRPRHVSERSLSSTNSTVRLARSATSSGGVRARGCGRACVRIDRAWNPRRRRCSEVRSSGRRPRRAASFRRGCRISRGRRRNPQRARVCGGDRLDCAPNRAGGALTAAAVGESDNNGRGRGLMRQPQAEAAACFQRTSHQE